MTTWILFPIHHFPLSDFRAVVNAQVRIGRSGLLWKKHVLALETIRENRGDQTSVRIGVAAVCLPIGTWSLGFGSDDV